MGTTIMKPKSQFATALTLLMDESNLCNRKQWAEILGVTEPAISQWLNDRTLPRPEFLRGIVNTVRRNANRVPKGIIEEFAHIAGKPAAEVSPFADRIGQSVNAYLAKPLLDGFFDVLTSLLPEAQERLLPRFTELCLQEAGVFREIESHESRDASQEREQADCERQLRSRVTDADMDVACDAIRAVGDSLNHALVPAVLDRLAEPPLVSDAVQCLAKFGDHIVGTLRENLSDPSVAIEIRREIPQVLMEIGTQAAARALTESLLESDTTLRFRTISALNKLCRLHPALQPDSSIIETVLMAEVMGHYRSYQILGTLGESLDSEDYVLRTLRETMEIEVERIFRLLSLLNPQYDLHSAYVGLQSKSTVVHDSALGFLDNVLEPQLRSALVPLLDSEVSVGERAQLATSLVHTSVETREEAVAALVASEDPWLRSCGAYAIGTLRLFALAEKLEDCLTDDDPLPRKTAREAKLRLYGAAAAVASGAGR